MRATGAFCVGLPGFRFAHPGYACLHGWRDGEAVWFNVRHGRAWSRPSTSCLFETAKDVDARHDAGHDEPIGDLWRSTSYKRSDRSRINPAVHRANAD